MNWYKKANFNNFENVLVNAFLNVYNNPMDIQREVQLVLPLLQHSTPDELQYHIQKAKNVALQKMYKSELNMNQNLFLQELNQAIQGSFQKPKEQEQIQPLEEVEEQENINKIEKSETI